MSNMISHLALLLICSDVHCSPELYKTFSRWVCACLNREAGAAVLRQRALVSTTGVAAGLHLSAKCHVHSVQVNSLKGFTDLVK